MSLLFDSIQTEPGIGLEEIAVQAFAILIEELNGELEATELSKVQQDQWLDDLRGRQFAPTTLEPVQGDNFHLGHVPSLILDDTPLESYPAVSVMCYRAQPSPGAALLDQTTAYVDSLYVEALVKAGPEDPAAPHLAAEMCDRRIWRTVESINRVLLRNQTLNGIVNGLENPTAIVSEVFTRPESDLNPENAWYWQAGRVEYAVTKFSPFE